MVHCLSWGYRKHCTHYKRDTSLVMNEDKLIEKLLRKIQETDNTRAAVWLINHYMEEAISICTSDLADSAIYADGVAAIEEVLEQKDYKDALVIAEDIAQEMLYDMGFDS
jgi:hypothetical protein